MRIFPVNSPGPGKLHSRVPRRAAFTLVEILLVVAMLGIIATAFVSGAADLFRTQEPRGDDVFWQSVTAARQLALESNQTVFLKYNQEKHLLELIAQTGPAKTWSFPGKQLDFLPVTAQGMMLLGGQLTETDAIKFVRFYADGCCDGFRVQLLDEAGRRQVLSIDPWTCAPVFATPSK